VPEKTVFMAATQPQPSGSPIEAEVRRIEGVLRQGQLANALAAAQTLLAKVPENRDVLYLVAVAQRYLGRVADALRTLERFETLHPEYGRLFQERGHCYRDVGEPNAAIAAYQRAVDLNPALLASWQALAALYRATGQRQAEGAATAQAQTLARLPPPVLNASGLFAEGDVFGAEALVRGFLMSHGNHIEGMRLLARIGMQLEVLDDAEFLLESVLVLAPDYHAARYEYSIVLNQRHKYARALEEAERLVRLDPTDRAFQIARASAFVGLGNHEAAIQVYRNLAEQTPEAPDLHLSIGHALKTLGRQSQAIESYRRAAAVRPSFGDAYWSLANLKTYRFTDQEMSAMRAQAAGDVSLVDRYHLCFALGKALEDRAEYPESFRFYERGNALKRAESRYDPAQIERTARLNAGLCTREFFTARRGQGCDRADPIFIVGLPRAGSTLLEQILASHSKVEGTAELADIPRLVHRLNGRDQRGPSARYPAVLAELTPEQLNRCGENFIRDTQVYRTGLPHFIDKMPNNFRHIGLLQLILPNAKIIDARREPIACCFSNFKQLFASGQEFTYSFEDIARYYRCYVELMAHWDAVLPGKVLHVEYEEVVADLEGNVRRILEFCELEFEPACIDFYKTERSVRTASSEQVRQPIFKEGLEQWRHFEPYLEPLRKELGLLVVPAIGHGGSTA
jgi:tetratricopeptide (TPR) repeat protein